MKKLFLTAVIIITTGFLGSSYSQAPSTAPAAKIKWYDFEEAVAASKKNPKKMFLDMYTDWCGWCKKMDQSTFINPVIVEYMNKHFYAVKFNAERKDTVNYNGKAYVNPNPTGKRSSHQLAQALLNGRMSYPSFVFLNEKQEMITIVPGYRKAPEFESILVYIGGDIYQTKKWEEFSASFTPKAKEE
jgi:thioredoxin-related protein